MIPRRALCVCVSVQAGGAGKPYGGPPEDIRRLMDMDATREYGDQRVRAVHDMPVCPRGWAGDAFSCILGSHWLLSGCGGKCKRQHKCCFAGVCCISWVLPACLFVPQVFAGAAAPLYPQGVAAPSRVVLQQLYDAGMVEALPEDVQVSGLLFRVCKGICTRRVHDHTLSLQYNQNFRATFPLTTLMCCWYGTLQAMLLHRGMMAGGGLNRNALSPYATPLPLDLGIEARDPRTASDVVIQFLAFRCERARARVCVCQCDKGGAGAHLHALNRCNTLTTLHCTSHIGTKVISGVLAHGHHARIRAIASLPPPTHSPTHPPL